MNTFKIVYLLIILLTVQIYYPSKGFQLLSQTVISDSLSILKERADSLNIANIKEARKKQRDLKRNKIAKSKNILSIRTKLRNNNSNRRKNRRDNYVHVINAYEKYLEENLLNNGFIIDKKNSLVLEQYYKEKSSLFLASREIYKNSVDYNFNSSIYSDIEIKGKIVKINIEIYSNFKNRIVYNGTFEGHKNELLTFFKNITQTIFNTLKFDIIPENVFPVDDNYLFYKYLILLRYQEEQKFEKAFDILEDLDISNKINNCPILKGMYEELKLKKINKDQKGKYIGNLLEADSYFSLANSKENSTKKDIAEQDTEKYMKNLIKEGYKLILKSDLINIDETDSTRFNLIVEFQIKFKRAYKSILLRKINANKADKRWRNMGRYFFSQNDKENDDVISILKDQILKFTVYDIDDKELLEEEITIDLFDFESGVYDNLKLDPIFPLNPISPTINGFRITNNTSAVFVIKDLDIEMLDKIHKSKIEMLFE